MQLRKVKYHKMQFDIFTIWQNVHHFEKAPGQSVVSQASDSVESPTHRLLSPLQARILNLDPDPQDAEHWVHSVQGVQVAMSKSLRKEKAFFHVKNYWTWPVGVKSVQAMVHSAPCPLPFLSDLKVTANVFAFDVSLSGPLFAQNLGNARSLRG